MSTLPEPRKSSKLKGVAEPGQPTSPEYVLRLFVSGMLRNSILAIKNLNNICEQHISGRYELEIIDINLQPDMAISEQIVVIPLLIIKFPLPEKRLIGDLSDTSRVLEVLNINSL